MSDTTPHSKENLVQVYKARNEVEGEMIVGYLRDNDIEAALWGAPSVPPLDDAEKSMTLNEKIGSVHVLEHDAERARRLVAEFFAASPVNESELEAAADGTTGESQDLPESLAEAAEKLSTLRVLGWVMVGIAAVLALLWKARN